MKLRTAVISVAVSLSLVAGAGYGAYYAINGRKSPVNVVPVSNVNLGYWGDTSSFYGTVTSQVAQTVELNEEYTLDKIYVEAGDTVKEGDKLFSYDMTLPELELEMEQLSLQTQELNLTKLEKDLETLKKTPATASLEQLGDTMTTSAEEDGLIIEESVEESEAAPADQGQQETTDPQPASDVQATGETTENDPGTSSGENQSGQPSSEAAPGNQNGNSSQENGLSVDSIETVPGGDPAGEDDAAASLVEAAVRYQQLVAAVDAMFQAYGSQLEPQDMETVGNAIQQANDYFRKNLADEQLTQSEDAAGNAIELREYEIKPELREALGAEETAALEEYQNLMETYHVKYVELLISQADTQNTETLSQDIEAIRTAYESLSSSRQAKVIGMDKLAELEQLAAYSAEDGKAETEEGGQEESGQEESGEQSGQSEPETAQDASEITQPGQEDETGETQAAESQTESGAEQLYRVFVSSNEVQAPAVGQSNFSAGSTVELDASDYVEKEKGYDFVKWSVSTEAGEKISLNTDETNEHLSFTMPETNVIAVCEQKKLNMVVVNGVVLGYYKPGETVTVTANLAEGETFTQWIVASPQETDTFYLADSHSPETTFVMPEADVTIYTAIAPEDLQAYVDGFVGLVEAADAAAQTGGAEYQAALGTAVDYYQMNLGQVPAEMITPGSETVASMEDYRLSTNVQEYLNGQDKAHMIEELQASYKRCAIAYVRTTITNIGPRAFENVSLAEARATLDHARELYQSIGSSWQEEMEEQWMEELTEQLSLQTQTETSADGTENTQDTAQTDESEGFTEGEQTSQEQGTGQGYSLAQLLDAYEVVLMIQGIAADQPEELLIPQLQKIRDSYYALPESVRYQVWNSDILLQLLEKYNLLEEEPGQDPEPGYPDGMDFGGDMEEGYTAAELAEMIKDKEQEIKTCKLSVREAELAVKQKQRIVDGKTVTSTMDGTVISVGESDGTSDTDYFIKVASDAGLYAKGSMNELALQTINVGDTISGMLLNSGESFTAVIKEISQYPDPNGSSMSYSYGSENSNASYYPFYALIEGADDMEEGEAELQLSDTMKSYDDGIYLESYFVLKENNGKSYVWKQGDDGKLTKQYVTVGKTVYGGMGMEIVEGVTLEDRIAFPYGKNVVEGAETNEVDALESNYM